MGRTWDRRAWSVSPGGSSAIRPRSLQAIEAEFANSGVRVLHTQMHERDAFRAIFSFGGSLSDLDLGNCDVGERESGTGKLEEAVAAYREALKERTRERVPLDWARTQMNLGTALLRLGERESGTGKLEEAVTAFNACLTVTTPVWPPERGQLDMSTCGQGDTMKTIAIISQKGGAGKTTLSVHLATAAALSGHSAAIIDLDPQGTAASWGDRRQADAPEVVSGQAARLGVLIEAAQGNGADPCAAYIWRDVVAYLSAFPAHQAGWFHRSRSAGAGCPASGRA